MKNTLYYGDNLDILKKHISDGSVDLIYLDPPFKSGKIYNIIFRPQLNKFKGATSQLRTFEDTWHWGEEAEREYQGLITGDITKEKPNQKLIELIKSMRAYLRECSLMAYLCMMAPRLFGDEKSFERNWQYLSTLRFRLTLCSICQQKWSGCS